MGVSRDVLRSAEMARRILWTDRDVPLKDFATITKAYAIMFHSVIYHFTSLFAALYLCSRRQFQRLIQNCTNALLLRS
jgi:hypothetical protein